MQEDNTNSTNQPINYNQNYDSSSKSNNKLLLTVAGIIIFFGGWFIGNSNFSMTMLRVGDYETLNPDLPEELDYSSANEVYTTLRDNYDGELTTEELLEGIKQGLARSTGDPHTEYLNEEQAREFDDDLQGTFSGIGAELSKDNDSIVVVAPISGFPAEEAGIQSQDIIVGIDGEDTFDMSLTEAVSKIRGDAGTDVNLEIVRDNETLEFTITRDDIKIPSVESEIIDGGIGYLKIARFSDDTVGLAREAAQEFIDNDVEGVILDVRNNPGGLLHVSVDLAGIWLESGELVLEERRGGEVIDTLRSSGDAILGDLPTVVLINEGSASASEIVAGALADHDIAITLGQESFGKGSVQQLSQLNHGGVLKVTTARWYTPEGINIEEEGINPQIEVERTTEDYINDIDPQKDTAIEELR